MLDLLLHRFRNDIAPVCPILHPQCPIHCRCAFHPHCALRCSRVAIAPSMPLHCQRAFDSCCLCAVNCRGQHHIVMAPSIAVAVDRRHCHRAVHHRHCQHVAMVLSIAVVASALPSHLPLPSPLCRCRFLASYLWGQVLLLGLSESPWS